MIETLLEFLTNWGTEGYGVTELLDLLSNWGAQTNEDVGAIRGRR